jgi:hypothetical protein
MVPFVLLLGACGDDSGSAAADPTDSSSESAEPSEPTETTEPTASASELPDWPACDDVWVAGAEIPGGYQGCIDGDQAVKADNLSCESGQRIVRYDDRFFGVSGGKIYEVEAPLDKDKQYLDMVHTCRG